MIAINRFRGPFLGNEQLIRITCYSAQFLILRGAYLEPLRVTHAAGI